MMDTSHNFLDDQKIYFESRKIPIETIETLINLGSLKPKEESFCLAMKDIEGNIVGWQERFLTPLEYTGKELLSKEEKGSKTGLFFEKMDYTKPIIVVEGELDYLALMNIGNVIGISKLDQLKELIQTLKRKKVSEIWLLLNNTFESEVAMNKLLNMDDCMDMLFDCKETLGSHKDIVSCLIAGGKITVEELEKHKNSFDMVKQFTNMFTLDKGKINHNEFAKHIIKKFNIGSTQTNLFIYDHGDKKGIRQPLEKQYAEKLIMRQLESLLSYAVSHFRINDLKHTLDFMIANANAEEIKYGLLMQNEREINLMDGILEIETMKVRSYTKEDYKFQKLSYSKDVFDTYSEPEKFLHFLDEILEGAQKKEEIKSFLQEFIGWLFVASTKFDKALLIYGSGANGKGVLLSVIKGILGTQNCSSIGLHEINKDQYLYNLIGKLANIDSDMQQNVQLDSGIIKKLVSGEPISAKSVYKQPIEFVPYCRILIATNDLPYLKTIDNSIRRRFVFLNLKQSFYGKEDHDLVNKILAEKNNIFVRAIEGLTRLLERGKFAIPHELDEELENFIKENDTIELFFEDGSIVRDKIGKIYNKEIYLGYKMFCNECGYKALSQRNFNKRLRDKGFEDFRDGLGRGFLGLRDNNPF